MLGFRQSLCLVRPSGELSLFVVAAYGLAGSAFTSFAVSLEDWARVMRVNLDGVWYCMRAEIPELLKHRNASIVNTASSLGLVGIARQAAYVTAKHGVVGLTRAAAMEYSSRGNPY